MTEKPKILVTGGAGYIGSHTVVELANAGYEPVIIDNFSNAEPSVLKGIEKIAGKPIKFYEGDCNDLAYLENLFRAEKNVSGIIHFAAYKAVGESVVEPLKYYENNIGSLMVLLKLMKKYTVSDIVFSSSCTVYGQPDQLPVTEKTPKKPAESPYGNTKQICEEILEDTVKGNQIKKEGKLNIKAIALRYFNPVGAHPSSLIGELPIGIPNNLVPFITQTAAGMREKIVVFGDDYNTSDGTCIRDYIHVVDLAKAHVKALEYLAKQDSPHFYDTFNIGTGGGNTVLEVIKTFEKASGQKLNYEIGPMREGDIEKIYANVEKANHLLEWRAKINLEESLRDAWAWQLTLQKRND